MRNFLIYGILSAALGVSEPAAAASTVATPQLNARIVSEQAVVRPGETLTLALDQRMAASWHTYWRNPGDSGQAPKINWHLPEGATAGPLQWPTPDRVPFGPLVNYGYSERAVLLTEIRVPAGWPAGTAFPVAADAELLVCQQICIPVDAKFRLEIPTGAVTMPAAELAPLFTFTRAQIPRPSPAVATALRDGDKLQLRIPASVAGTGLIKDAYFFADSWGLIEPAGRQAFTVTDGTLALTMPRGQVEPGALISGVLAVETEGSGGGSRLSVGIEGATVSAGPIKAAADVAAPPMELGLAALLMLAFAGGLLLNLMPCVFPVLALKALALAKHADAGRAERTRNALAFAAGVVLSFVGLAGVLLLARAGGATVGWGFHLQSPLMVGILAYVMAAIGLNLSGVFEIGSRFTGFGNAWAGRPGLIGAAATGVITAVVAAPCTAPFMAAAAGAAVLLAVPQALLVFAVMGLGLAFPYCTLAVSPSLSRRLPKPGPWMLRFRQALAFPMYATAAWLLWVLAEQAGAEAALQASLGIVVLAFALWLLPLAAGWPRGVGVALALLGSAMLLAHGSATPPPMNKTAAVSALAEPYSAARLAELRAEGRAVLVNMTAAWCITCKVNEKIALSGESFAETLKTHRIAYLQGDWTVKNPDITAYLESFGRAGVPLYVLYPTGGGEPKILPQLLDPGALGRALTSSARLTDQG